jgi:glycosyltransferase involved in cell wall biosynthesis
MNGIEPASGGSQGGARLAGRPQTGEGDAPGARPGLHDLAEPAVRPDLSLVLPCYNEEDSLRVTVSPLVRRFREAGCGVELVLVDNGSKDRTSRIIDELIEEGLPVRKQTVAVNQGYGYGVLCGLALSRGAFVGFMGADGQVEPEDVVRLYEIARRAKTPKLVKVRRRFRLDGPVRAAVSLFYNLSASALFGGLGSLDINGSPKILPREVAERMRLESRDWFLDAEVMIKAKRIGLPVYELNVFGRMREEGRSHVKAGTCWEFLVNLLRYRFAGAGSGAGGGEA